MKALLHKKSPTTENYKPISLLNHPFNMFTIFITVRLEKYFNFYQPREAEFRAGYRTNHLLHYLKVLIEKTLEYNGPLIIVFQKAFEIVEIGPNLKERIFAELIRNIPNLYTTTTAI